LSAKLIHIGRRHVFVKGNVKSGETFIDNSRATGGRVRLERGIQKGEAQSALLLVTRITSDESSFRLMSRGRPDGRAFPNGSGGVTAGGNDTRVRDVVPSFFLIVMFAKVGITRLLRSRKVNEDPE